jgi:hypothetical protein
MGNWQLSEIIAFWALVVALVGIPITIWTTRKWGTRRSKLLVAFSSTGLLATQTASDNLKVSFRDLPVGDPHLVSVLVKNTGPNDITRDQFDGGKPLGIALNSILYGAVQIRSSDGISPGLITGGIGDKNAIVGFQPALLPKGTEWVADFIVSGPATPKVVGRLVNTDIVEGESGITPAVLHAARLLLGFR